MSVTEIKRIMAGDANKAAGMVLEEHAQLAAQAVGLFLSKGPNNPPVTFGGYRLSIVETPDHEVGQIIAGGAFGLSADDVIFECRDYTLALMSDETEETACGGLLLRYCTPWPTTTTKAKCACRLLFASLRAGFFALLLHEFGSQKDTIMLKQAKIEAVIEELARQQGHELNAADMLEIRCRVACTLAAKERHRRRMTAPEYRWRKPDKLRR